MPRFLITWLLATVALLITANLVPGFRVNSIVDAAIASAILGLVNAIVRPIVFLLTLPVTILSLGLFLFVINALMILLVGQISPGFRVDGFWPALIGSIVLTIVSWVLHLFFPNRNND
uniref:Phage holin family protein n=1 Tax=Cyanothece sp. (strain PCC 7425 / ATCC 29141) TaxID=395961 RepID=B8HQ06_CYAP4